MNPLTQKYFNRLNSKQAKARLNYFKAKIIKKAFSQVAIYPRQELSNPSGELAGAWRWFDKHQCPALNSILKTTTIH